MTHEEAARAYMESVRDALERLSVQDIDKDLVILSPERADECGYGREWAVMFERGGVDLWGESIEAFDPDSYTSRSEPVAVPEGWAVDVCTSYVTCIYPTSAEAPARE